MSRYKLALEIKDNESHSEEYIDTIIRDALSEHGIDVIDSAPFVEVESDEDNIFEELQEFAENYKDDDIEITYDKGSYYVLHICKNNMPVPLFYTSDINIIIDYLKENYGYSLERK